MDIAALKSKLAASRLAWVQVGEFRFQIRRPGRLDFLRLAARGHDATALEAAIAAVRDWEGVTGRHFGEETDEPVPFDTELVEPLINDRSDLIYALTNAVAEMMIAEHKADTEKKA